MSAPGSLYEVLGVPKNADTNEIRKAFKNLSRQHHPDKGGDAEMFKKIQHAHEILTDERKRQIYDMTGSEDGEVNMGNPFGGMGGFGGPFGGPIPVDIGSMFGGMFGMGGPPGRGGGMKVKRQQAPPKTQEIPLSLHDFYHGRQFEVKFERQKFCEPCKGEGATSFQQCSKCQGRGIVRQVMMMGPIQMINEGPCEDCQGEGKKASGNCYLCGGKKTMPQEKILNVSIEPGMRPGEVLIFAKECSDDPNYVEPGDVHLILQEADGDDGWVRKGDDLYTDMRISLGESLLGCKKILKGHPGYPDGLEIDISCGVQNGEVLQVQEKGFVKKGKAGYGNLHCKIHITVSDKDKEMLTRNEPLLKAMFSA